MSDVERFVRLVLEQPCTVLEAVAEWLRVLSENMRADASDLHAAREAADVIAACPDGNPAQLITRPILPAAINQTVSPGTTFSEFVDDHVVPFIAAQRTLSRYQMTACNMQAAECNQLLDLAELLDQATLLKPVCQQYVIFQLVFIDVLPADLLPETLRDFLPLYSVFGSKDAYTPVGVTNRLLAVLQSWLLATVAAGSTS